MESVIEKLEKVANTLCLLGAINNEQSIREVIKELEKSPRPSNQVEPVVMPVGLRESDTIEDALNRADRLATPQRYSGMLCSNKDLRRIVLLAYEYRKLKKA